VIGDAGEPLPALSADPLAPSRTKASPVARRIAARRGVDLASLTGTGPSGRVVRVDVERAVSAGHDAVPEAPRGIAESRATVPDLELRVEVDMGAAAALRELLREVAEPSPTIDDLIVKAVALALREFPTVNDADGDGSAAGHARINVGIVVAADDALVVPTIFDADQKSLGQISSRTRALAARVRDGSIARSELAGATFTVSNLGMYGVDSFSAVTNPPQSALLAVGALKRRPVVDESGEVVARPTILLTLACDHRILGGGAGARFLSRVRDLLERPYALVL